MEEGLNNALTRVREAACPLVFRTGFAEAPFSIHGTGFICKHKDRYFFVTVNHAVRNADPRRIVVYPAGRDPTVETGNWWRVHQDPDDPDLTDLFLLEIAPRAVTETVRRIGRVIDLSPTHLQAWRDERWSSTFFLTGHPAETNSADYETSLLLTGQVLIQGRYSREWPNGYCHELKVANPHELTDFSGFSGSPIFSCVATIGIGMPTRFCGIALRGSPTSGIVHFLGSSMVRAALEQATEDKDDKSG